MSTLKSYETNVINGLGSYTYTVETTAMYTMSAFSSVTPPSGISIVLSQTGSTTASATSTAPSSTQTKVNITKIFNCQAGDVLTFAITSSNVTDEQLNYGVTTIVKVNAGLI